MRYRVDDYSRKERKLNLAFSAVGYRGETRKDGRDLQRVINSTREREESIRATLFSSWTTETRRKLRRISAAEANKQQKCARPEASQEISAEVLEENGRRTRSYAKKRCIRLHASAE